MSFDPLGRSGLEPFYIRHALRVVEDGADDCDGHAQHVLGDVNLIIVEGAMRCRSSFCRSRSTHEIIHIDDASRTTFPPNFPLILSGVRFARWNFLIFVCALASFILLRASEPQCLLCLYIFTA